MNLTQELVIITFIVTVILLIVTVVIANKSLARATRAGAKAAKEEIKEQTRIVGELRSQIELAEWRNVELGLKLKAALSRLDISEELLKAAKLALNVAIDLRARDLLRIIQLESDLSNMRVELDDIKTTANKKIAQLEAENATLRGVSTSLTVTVEQTKGEVECPEIVIE